MVLAAGCSAHRGGPESVEASQPAQSWLFPDKLRVFRSESGDYVFSDRIPGSVSPRTYHFSLARRIAGVEEVEPLWDGTFPVDGLFWQNPKVLIDEAGPTVVLETERIKAGGGYVLWFLRDGKFVKRVSWQELWSAARARKLKKGDGNTSAEAESGSSLERADKIWESGGRLSFLRDDETGRSLFVLWFGAADCWLEWDLKTGELQKFDEKRAGELNEIARRASIKLIASVSKTGPREAERMLLFRGDGLRVAEDSYPQRDYEYKSAVKFIAQRNHPDDRVVLEAVLATPLSLGISSGGSERLNVYILSSSARALADRLLAQWEGKTVNPDLSERGLDDEKYFYLGSVEGRIIFPFIPERGQFQLTVVSQDSTSEPLILTYGVPRDVSDEYRSLPQEVLKYLNPPLPTNEIGFAVQGLTPGHYQIIARWSKEEGGKDTRDRELKPPSLWHYESAATPWISIDAGGLSDHWRLYCTNRIHDDEGLYEGDAERMREALEGRSGLAAYDRSAQFALKAAVLRHAMTRWKSRGSEAPPVWFIGRKDGVKIRDPDADLMRLFAAESNSIKPFTQSSVIDKRIVDKTTGLSGMYLLVGEPKWTEMGLVELRLELSFNAKESRSWRYVAVAEDSQWKVIGYRIY